MNEQGDERRLLFLNIGEGDVKVLLAFPLIAFGLGFILGVSELVLPLLVIGFFVGVLVVYAAPNHLSAWEWLTDLARYALARPRVTLNTPADSDERAFWQAYFAELYRTRFRKQDVLSRLHLTADYHTGKAFTVRDLRDWPGRLLIIESGNDQVIDEGDRGALKGMYPGAYIQTLPGYDHLAPLLASRELLASIRRFLNTQGT